MTEVKHRSFSPLMISTSGGMDTIATVVYKRIAAIITDSSAKQMRWSEGVRAGEKVPYKVTPMGPRNVCHPIWPLVVFTDDARWL